MEQFIARVIDGQDRPALGEEYRKRDRSDGLMKYYQLYEVASEQRGTGVELGKGSVEWTEITYNLKEIAPAE